MTAVEIELEAALALDDVFPIVIDGSFSEALLHVAFDLLGEFESFVGPTLSLDLFEDVT